MGRRKSVTFSETSVMAIVYNLSAGPQRRDIWFTQDELDLFKANRNFQARLVRMHITSNERREEPSAADVLGLEKFLTPWLTAEYAARRYRVAREVLNQARRRRRRATVANDAVAGAASVVREEDDDVDRLARVSARNSRWARERARAAALFLEKDQGTTKGTPRRSTC